MKQNICRRNGAIEIRTDPGRLRPEEFQVGRATALPVSEERLREIVREELRRAAKKL